ncbi:unnamed protein product [Adineta ricciae]|uniref:LIM zinc-binding domain-containing protein n=1 Tax=Adineta ricciae TaxID=249248 RepID=A0A813RH34_ADIRI|nr:unnamed protein product [Adineta ricciae]
MSSSPLSSENNTFVQTQTPFFNRYDANSTLPMSFTRCSPVSTSSSAATRIVGPKPFYRSQVTPDPFDYTNNHRRQVDYQQYLPNPSQRRLSINQINATDNDDDDDDDDNNNNDDELTSSDESLSIEFPPPPPAFCTPSVADTNCQFVPVKHTFIQTTVGRSDSGSSLSNSYLSDHEPPSTSIAKHSQYQSYRATTPTATNYNNQRPVISVNASQSPLITITARGSPSRSEIHFSPAPNSPKSTLREIRVSRPDSPLVPINRQGNNTPSITYANGNDHNIHASHGASTTTNQRELPVTSPPPTVHMFGRAPSPFRQIDAHRDSSLDNRYVSNVAANRFKPFIAYANPNSIRPSSFDGSESRSPSAVANLPPASSNSNSTPFTMRSGHTMKRDSTDVDNLARLLMKSINSSNEPNFFGMCARCNDEIVGEENGLVAMDRMYHVSCFTCTMCGCRLRGLHFYAMENKPYCESCYINSLEKCVVCHRPITDRILRATGKPYHAACFCCFVCRKSLDGVPFTIDATMEVHCIECFHQKFAPRCYACHRAILPGNGQEETIRIIALDRNYHVECYRCENCKVQFTTTEGCYPIDDYVLCLQCNRLYSRKMLGHI